MTRRLRCWLGLAAALAVGLGPGRVVEASPPESIDGPRSTPLIAAGELVVECGWPTAVSVSGAGQCSGTLIHPRVVVYAAHCGAGLKTIRFGEDAFVGGREVAVESCRAYPSYGGADDQGHDWAYCLLQDPVTELPPTPPLFGCEVELLDVGLEVALVGFGETTDASFDLKHWGASSLVAVTPSTNTTLVGDPDSAGVPSICPGDSGGPAFVALADGSWRTFGIASTVVGECGGYGAHALLPAAVAWIEWDSGVDVTPCHAADGSWAPGPACTGAFAGAANVGAGSWADWCSQTAAAGPSRSCGPAWDEFDAKLPPSVEIVSPSWGETFLDGAVLDIVVDATKDPQGYAVARVRLFVDEVELASDDNDPWVFEQTSFPGVGLYTLVAVAEDWAGNQVESVPVMIGFGDTEVPDPDTGGESEGETGPPLDDDPGSCSCASDRRPVGAVPVLVVIVLGVRRRRTTTR